MEKRIFNPSPQESQNRLIDTIINAGGEVSFDQIREIEEEANLEFGPGTKLVDVLTLGQELGFLAIDYKNETVKITPPSTTDL